MKNDTVKIRVLADGRGFALYGPESASLYEVATFMMDRLAQPSKITQDRLHDVTIVFEEEK